MIFTILSPAFLRPSDGIFGLKSLGIEVKPVKNQKDKRE